MSTATDLWDAQLTDIITITNRPALTAETALGLRQGTLRAHLSDHYPRDMVISKITNAGASTTQFTIATTTSFTRYRDVRQVKLLDVDNAVLDFPEVEIVEVGDQYVPGYPGEKRPYVAWQAGTNLNVYASSGTYGAEVTWLQSPNITRETYDSWIAQLMPDIIIWEAAMFIWNRTGNEAKAIEAHNMLYGQAGNIRSQETCLYALLKANYLNLAGR